jgi:ELWxxDGT repeat protein
MGISLAMVAGVVAFGISSASGAGEPGAAARGFPPIDSNGNLKGALFFEAQTLDGYELWKSDGTKAGTRQVADINEGPGDSFPGHFARLGKRILFHADDGERGRELWRTNGTPAGTKLVRNIAPGNLPSYPGDLLRFGDIILFRAHTPNTGEEGNQAGQEHRPRRRRLLAQLPRPPRQVGLFQRRRQ